MKETQVRNKTMRYSQYYMNIPGVQHVGLLGKLRLNQLVLLEYFYRLEGWESNKSLNGHTKILLKQVANETQWALNIKSGSGISKLINKLEGFKLISKSKDNAGFLYIKTTALAHKLINFKGAK